MPSQRRTLELFLQTHTRISLNVLLLHFILNVYVVIDTFNAGLFGFFLYKMGKRPVPK